MTSMDHTTFLTPQADAMEAWSIPEIYCPFPGMVNPCLQQAQQHTVEWVKKGGLALKERTLSRVADFVLSACMVYPHADPEELYICSDWIAWGFLYDDQFDSFLGRQPEYAHQVLDHLLALLQSSHPATPQGPAARALVEIWQRVKHLTSPCWQKRFVQHHKDYFTAVCWEMENQKHQCIPSMPIYMEKRRDSVSANICLDLLELAQRIEIPPGFYAENQPFQEFLRAVGNVFGWINDVCSLQKELASGDVNNLVIVIWHQERCTLQEAVSQACALIETETRRVQEMMVDFSTSLREVKGLDTYLSGIGPLLRGDLDWSLQTIRYNEKIVHPEQEYHREDILPFCERT